MSGRQKLSRVQIDAIGAAYAGGERVASIAARFGISKGHASQIGRLYAPARGQGPIQRIDKSALLRCYRAGVRVAEIASHLGCSVANVTKHARAAGIAPHVATGRTTADVLCAEGTA